MFYFFHKYLQIKRIYFTAILFLFVELTYSQTNNAIPGFVKEGSIIPMVPDFNSTDKYPNTLEIHYYPKENTETYALLYDDGVYFSAIEKEQCQLIKFAASNSLQLLHFIVETDKGEFFGKPDKRDLNIIVHDCTQKPNKIFLNGHLLKLKKKGVGDYFWDKEKNKLTINLIWKNQDLDLRIEK